MTENKRFDMIITSADGSFHYLDKNTGEKITSTLELENKLNELNNENEQLKHDASVLVQSNKDYRIENEQLKQKLQQCRKFLNDDLDIALGFISHKGYSLKDLKEYEKKLKGDVE